MAFAINDTAPDFEAQTTEGKIRFDDWIGDSWAILFSHPKAFTPGLYDGVRLYGQDQAGVPQARRQADRALGRPRRQTCQLATDIKETQGFAPNYPMIGDTDFNVAELYGKLPASVSGDAAARTVPDNQTVRTVFVIGADKKIKLILVYPMTTGRNFDEVLRVIDSQRLTAKHKVATPVNWRQGDDVIIAGSISDDEAKKQYPQGWKAPKPYIRIVPQPKS